MSEPEDEREDDKWTVISFYGDQDAINDGVIIPFYSGPRDTGHRITSHAFGELRDHYKDRHPQYDDAQFLRFFLNELLPLVSPAYEAWNHSNVLTTDFDFRVKKYEVSDPRQLWYEPNECRGITMMKPEDH